MVQEDNDNRNAPRINETNIKTLFDLLKEKLLLLSQETVIEWTSDEIATVAKLISIACEISCNETHQSPSLNDEDLFKNTIGNFDTFNRKLLVCYCNLIQQFDYFVHYLRGRCHRQFRSP